MPHRKDVLISKSSEYQVLIRPRRTPSHPKKSHIVVSKQGDKIKTIRFGQLGVSTAGKFL